MFGYQIYGMIYYYQTLNLRPSLYILSGNPRRAVMSYLLIHSPTPAKPEPDTTWHHPHFIAPNLYLRLTIRAKSLHAWAKRRQLYHDDDTITALTSQTKQNTKNLEGKWWEWEERGWEEKKRNGVGMVATDPKEGGK